MKLLTKYSRVNIVIAFTILLLSSIAYYYILRNVLIKQLDRDLKVEEQEIFDYVNENNQLPNASSYRGQQIFFEKAAANNIKRTIKSSSYYNKHEDEEEPIRVLTFPVNVNDVLYKAIVIKSQVESEHLLRLIVLITGSIFLALLALTAIINRFVLNKLWKPFYYTLNQLHQFNLKSAEPITLPATDLSEFKLLNASVTEMTKRVRLEFESLKAFADNASHEMQTPLAVINSKLDLLIQTSTLEQAEHVQAIYNAAGRLSKLNQTLLLLTKIDNEQYKSLDTVDLKELLEQKFQQFDELIYARNLTLTSDLANVSISLNGELSDILLNNLLSNAIRHNNEGGYIHCTLTKQQLTLINSGPNSPFDKNDIFKRFKKSDHSDGTGLGLAVVKQICEQEGFGIEYLNNNNEHTFIIHFSAGGLKPVN